MGFLGAVFSAVGEMVLSGVKDQTGIDIAKEINTVKGAISFRYKYFVFS